MFELTEEQAIELNRLQKLVTEKRLAFLPIDKDVRGTLGKPDSIRKT